MLADMHRARSKILEAEAHARDLVVVHGAVVDAFALRKDAEGPEDDPAPDGRDTPLPLVAAHIAIGLAAHRRGGGPVRFHAKRP